MTDQIAGEAASALRPQLPSTLVEPLGDNTRLVELIVRLTHADPGEVRRRLHDEELQIGTNVRNELERRGVAPHVWSDGLLRFYIDSDAFLYELIAWNRHPGKQGMRRWVGRYLARHARTPLDILCYGDGLGFDSCFLAQAGHRVTYFDLSDLSCQFAREVCRAAAPTVRLTQDAGQLRPESFDAVVCLDVLEHEPKPPELIARLVSYLRPGGLFIVNAPFCLISRDFVTHLDSNRRYSGALTTLYGPHGLALTDGRFFWDPLVLTKLRPGQCFGGRGGWRRGLIGISGVWLMGARVWAKPYAWLVRTLGRGKSPWAAELAAPPG